MARVRALSDTQVGDEERAAYEAAQGRHGSVPEPMMIWARSPAVPRAVTTLERAAVRHGMPSTRSSRHWLCWQCADYRLRIVYRFRHVPGANWRDETYTLRLERWCDEANAKLDPLTSFIRPGGSPATAQLHVARTVCRRAERHAFGEPDVNLELATYLNRLSDLLFLVSRPIEPGIVDLWQPALSRS